MKKKIFLLKCKILKHKMMSILWGILKYILAPFAILCGIIVGVYGAIKGMTVDEIKWKFLDQYREAIMKYFQLKMD